jgi:predicted CxxxxCH...CXXCH cytochrome family protein
MAKKRESCNTYSQMVTRITVLLALTVGAGTVQAASVLNSCVSYCHGVPPRDAVRKGNPHFGSQSSAFLGNHRNHLPAVPAAASCSICHAPVAATDFGHQNNIIKMANSLKGYSSAALRAKYDKGVFFNQTSIPNLTNATCSNVNCHFEKKTPAWGTSASATTCETCHGALVTPLTLAHPKHIAGLGNTISACASCHNNYTGAAAYTHATSAGRAIKVTVGAYAGSNNKYLPSQTGRVTGTCSTVVCHGSGTLLPWSGTLWSATDQCGKCHSSTVAGAITQAVPFFGTAYPTKVTLNTNAKVGAHTSHLTAPDSLATAFICADCHGTVALNTATHLNGITNFTWSALATKNGTLTPTYTAATGSCANMYCHGASMPGGDTTGTNRAPTWISSTYLPATIGSGGTACKICHGFPPLAASGHPALTTAVPATFGNGTVAIGTSCNCHANISTTGTTYANIFVNKALHINGVFEPAASGHAVPFYAHATPPFTSCTGCHNASAAGIYPAAAGAAPNCRGCHATADPTVTTTGCSSCHANPPNGAARPNIAGSHAKHGAITCASCHNGAGSGSGASHGPGSRGTNPAVDNVIFTAAQAGASATWTAATKTCSTTYCHGATLTGGTAKSPVWGTTLTGCALCHGDPPATTTHSGVTVTQCITCHDHVNAAGTGFTNAALHINGVIDAAGGTCIGCHATVQIGTHGTPRDAVMSEFGLAWGHKKTGRGAVTDADCIVCHLEGEFATQKTSATKHKDGNIDLRNPDGVGEAAITNISGGAFTFTKFAMSFAAGSRTSTGHTSNTDIANVITQKFCLACHDSNGATNTTARSNNGGTGTAAMPFGGRALGATYTAANNAVGTQGLVDVKTQFALTNSSRHPVLGPRTRDFPYSTRLAVPYNNIGTTRDANGTTGHTTAASVVINCFDCHNTPTTPLTTRTVAAHGNAVTLRGTVYAGSAASTLCTTCHTGYTGTGQHGVGSAWAVTGSSHNVSRGCEYCHGSQTSTTAQVRPIRAQDYHGSNARVGGGLWPTVNSRPYAFIRGWSGTAYHRPYRATEFTTGSATCGAGACPGGGQVGDGSTRTYTPGGTY